MPAPRTLMTIWINKAKSRGRFVRKQENLSAFVILEKSDRNLTTINKENLPNNENEIISKHSISSFKKQILVDNSKNSNYNIYMHNNIDLDVIN